MNDLRGSKVKSRCSMRETLPPASPDWCHQDVACLKLGSTAILESRFKVMTDAMHAVDKSVKRYSRFNFPEAFDPKMKHDKEPFERSPLSCICKLQHNS